MRRGGAQGEKQIDKKGERNKEGKERRGCGQKRGWSEQVQKYRGGEGMKECANLSLRSLGLQKTTMRTVRGWWEDERKDC